MRGSRGLTQALLGLLQRARAVLDRADALIAEHRAEMEREHPDDVPLMRLDRMEGRLHAETRDPGS